MSGFFAIVKKELRAVTREKTLVIAIVIQLFIASFSSALLIGLISLYDPDSIGMYARIDLDVGVLGDPRTQLVRFMRERGIRTTSFTNPADAEGAFNANAVDAIVVVPEDSGGVVEMQLFLPRAEARAALILMILREPLKRFENYLRQARGVQVLYGDLTGLPPTTFEFLYSVIVPVLMFFPAFVAGSMVVDSISEELENHTLETLLSAPLSLNVALGGKIAAALVLAVMQCAAWAVLLRFNRIYLQNLALVLLLAAIVAAIIAIASAFIATAFKDRERSQFVYSLFILVAVSASYIFDLSPIKLMTRLATGDYFTGVADVAKYAAVVLVMLFVLLRGTRRMAVVG